MELSLSQVLVLAVVQGVTEFLPISSDGHIVVTAALMAPGGAPESFDVSDVNIVLHGGTLVSILVVYWQRVWQLLDWRQPGFGRLLGLLMVATLPAVIVGLPIKKYASDTIMSNPLIAGYMLLVTAAILLWAAWGRRGPRDYPELGYDDALLLGLGQAAAILPGLSRSGTTISIGLRLGLAPRAAATFSFLMALPVIGGACVLEMKDQWEGGVASHASPLSLAVGATVSFLVGWVTLWSLVRWLERGKLHYFAWWCIPVGLGVIAWQLSK